MQEIKKDDDDVVDDDWWNNLDDDEFQEMFRMSKTTLIDLQAEIDYSENVFLDRVDKFLLASVWILGNTKSFKEAEEVFNMENLEADIHEYFAKILKLGSSYVIWPKEDELKVIENGFLVEYKFPKLVGVIGSLHIEVNPGNTADKAVYYNHIMQKRTIVLQVVCDNNLLLRDVCVGCPGGQTIKDILESSPLYSLLTDANSSLVKNDYLLLGGTEHPRLNNLLTPFKFVNEYNSNDRHLEFNVLHNSVMCVVEKTFKCLETRFPRLTSVDKFSPEMASLLASCICVLHNFTRVRNDRCDLYF